MKQEQINIGTITDTNYTQHTGVMLFSIMKNCQTPSDLHFFIMDGGLDENSKSLLKQICNDFNSKISFIKPDLSKFNGLKIGRHLTPIIYAKLLFPEILKNLKRIIVMDSDIIVEGDMKELFNMPLNGKILGAIPDGCIELQENCKKKLGMDPNREYLNSGVMLIDVKKWRKNNVLNRVIKFIKENPEKISVQDQDGLNATLQGEWQELPYEWNAIHLFYYHSLDLKKKLGKKRLNEIIRNPKIIHFTIKPWVFEKVHPRRNRYWHYLRQTPWKDFKYPKVNAKTISLKLLRLLISPIPWEIKIKIKNLFNKLIGKEEKTEFYLVGSKDK